MIDATATSIPLTGLALALFATSAVCLVLSAITVSLRLYARLQDSALGLDDGLILAGLVRLIPQPFLPISSPRKQGQVFQRWCKQVC